MIVKQWRRKCLMNRALTKMKEAGLFNDEDMQTAINTAVQEAVPVIAEKTTSPDNIQKKVGLYKQSVVSGIMNVGGTQ